MSTLKTVHNHVIAIMDDLVESPTDARAASVHHYALARRTHTLAKVAARVDLSGRVEEALMESYSHLVRLSILPANGDTWYQAKRDLQKVLLLLRS